MSFSVKFSFLLQAKSTLAVYYTAHGWMFARSAHFFLSPWGCKESADRKKEKKSIENTRASTL